MMPFISHHEVDLAQMYADGMYRTDLHMELLNVKMHLVENEHQRSAVVDRGFMSCWLPV